MTFGSDYRSPEECLRALSELYLPAKLAREYLLIQLRRGAVVAIGRKQEHVVRYGLSNSSVEPISSSATTAIEGSSLNPSAVGVRATAYGRSLEDQVIPVSAWETPDDWDNDTFKFSEEISVYPSAAEPNAALQRSSQNEAQTVVTYSRMRMDWVALDKVIRDDDYIQAFLQGFAAGEDRDIGTTPAANRRGRPRSEKWPDWLAAAIVRAVEGKINLSTDARSLMKEVSFQMKAWGLKSMAESTVEETAERAATRLAAARRADVSRIEGA